jgi:hypothetical protein
VLNAVASEVQHLSHIVLQEMAQLCERYMWRMSVQNTCVRQREAVTNKTGLFFGSRKMSD